MHMGKGVEGLHIIDAVIIIPLLVSLWIGFSILATLVSSITFLAYPGEGFSGNWIRLVLGLMVPAVLVTIIWGVVPLYRNVTLYGWNRKG